jgi:hypothetical protein
MKTNLRRLAPCAVLAAAVWAAPGIVSGQTQPSARSPAQAPAKSSAGAPAKTPAKAAAKSAAQKEKARAPLKQSAKGPALERPKKSGALKDLGRSQKITRKASSLPVTIQPGVFPLAAAKQIARHPKVKTFPIWAISRSLYMLEVEAPSEATALRNAVKPRMVRRSGKTVDSYPDIEAEVQDLHSRYDPKCTGKVVRKGDSWPPAYECADPQVVMTTDAAPVVTLSKPPVLLNPQGSARRDEKPVLEDKALQAVRVKAIADRDAFAVPGENLSAPPRQFCVGAQCFDKYKEVVSALYGTQKSGYLPVFCAPRKTGGQWAIDKVHCSADWIDTLGGWRPWKANGEASEAPEPGVIPPYACFGNPKFLSTHTVLPPGGKAGDSGFYCRNRIFKVMAKKAPQSHAEKMKNIALQCQDMRQQVWGEIHKDIASEYHKWCKGPEGPKDKSVCLPPPPVAKAGEAPKPVYPYMQLSREEMLYFFSHNEFFCRADRPGLVHFLFNKPWAKTFTCGLSRGLLESGPFEEGVQVCALSPYYSYNPPKFAPMKHPFKARLHCWQFNRPTCEEVQLESGTKELIQKSNLFDAYDALREYRRTRAVKAMHLFDFNDADKLQDFSEVIGFSDGSKDEGTLGIKQFCRFVGSLKRIQCGFTKETMARWYELRQHERPAGCKEVCQRGSFQQGYLCGLFSSPEMFEGQPYWMCGLADNLVGRRVVRAANAVCLGGAAMKAFQSALGDTSTLKCFQRRYKWGESKKSEAVLDSIDWPQFLKAAAETVQKDRRNAADEAALLKWAETYNHTLGHRTALRVGLLRASIPAIQELMKLPELKVADILYADVQDEAIEKPTPEKEAAKQKKIEKEKQAKAKALNDLITEVKKGERAASGKWWQEFRLEAMEKGKQRVRGEVIALMERVNRIFEILDTARGVLLEKAKEYADHVFAYAKGSKYLLTRPEVHELARDAIIAERHKGSIYCIADHTVTEEESGKGKHTFVCASSPLLIAGAVEQIVDKRKGEFQGSKDSPQWDAFLQKTRGQVKTEWCYGGTEKKPIYGQSPTPALYGTDLSSPFQLEVPPGVLDLATYTRSRNEPVKWKSGTNWLKCASFAYSDENWQKAEPGKGAPTPAQAAAFFWEMLGAGGGGDAAQITNAVGGFVVKLISLVSPKFGKALEAIKNLATASMDFIENWVGKFADLAKNQSEELKKRQEKAEQAVADAKEGVAQAEKDLKDTKKKTADEVKEVSQKELDKAKETQKKELEALKKLEEEAQAEKLKVVKETRDAATAAQEKYEAAAIKTGAARAKLKAAQGPAKEAAAEKVQEAASAEADAKNAWKDAETAAKEKVKAVETEWNTKVTAAQKAYKEAVKAAFKEAKDKITEARNQAKEQVAAAETALKAAQAKLVTKQNELKAELEKLRAENGVIKGSGQLYTQMVEELLEKVTKGVMQALTPAVKDLFKKGFSYVRKLLGVVAKAIIGALGSIPFVGGALAAAAAVAYDFGMNALEDFAVEKLLVLVELLVSKLVRAILGNIMKGTEKVVLKLVAKAVCVKFKEICPTGGNLRFAELPPASRWIERALACKAPPVIDQDRMQEIAVAARIDLIRQTQDLERRAPVLARAFADRYLAHFGVTSGQLINAYAGVKTDPSIVAFAKEIDEQIRKKADEWAWKILGR